jgi:uncharacterized protein (TIGR00290 family)
MKERVVVSWSGGKDSALALHRLRNDERYDVVALLTTRDEKTERISAHGVRSELIEKQAESIGLPLEWVNLPKNPTNDEYVERFSAGLARIQVAGAHAVAFGDIFLEDLKQWRERVVAQTGLRAIFPLWNEPTTELAHAFSDGRFSAVVCCVDASVLGANALGQTIDRAFLASLPQRVDPCGENGEFHSVVFEGPIFRRPLQYRIGETIEQAVDSAGAVRHLFCDVTLVET